VLATRKEEWEKKVELATLKSDKVFETLYHDRIDVKEREMAARMESADKNCFEQMRDYCRQIELLRNLNTKKELEYGKLHEMYLASTDTVKELKKRRVE